MGRFRTAGEEAIAYSDQKPERCEPPRGAKFLCPGEDEPRECGRDPAMPPASPRPHWQREVNLGFAGLKRKG